MLEDEGCTGICLGNAWLQKHLLQDTPSAASSVCQGILQMLKFHVVENTQDVTQETWRSVLLQAEIMAANEWFATDDQNLARFQFVLGFCERLMRSQTSMEALEFAF